MAHAPAPVEPSAGELDALARLAEAEDTLRAIRTGEVDAIVIGDGPSERRVFTLSTADRPYRTFVENMRDGAATISSSGLVLWANSRLAELLLCRPETLVGSPLAHFQTVPADLSVNANGSSGGYGGGLELSPLASDGRVVPVLAGISQLEAGDDRITCVTFTDLSAQKAQEREISRLGHAQVARLAELQVAQAALTEQATHDALTGLPNRSLLVDRLHQALAHAERTGLSLAVLFIDLDRFKHVNDTDGHAAGDIVLGRVAERLSSAVRPMDTVARIGGDEFVVLAPDVHSELQALDVSTRLLTALCHRSAWREEGEPIPASIGIAFSAAGRGTAEILLGEADTAMYKAKARGGSCAEAFDAALGDQVHQRARSRRVLEAALHDHRIVLHYQPVIDLASGSAAGFEALARIAEPDGSILSPADFIPIAEASGLVVPLGAQVLELACDQVRRWEPAGGLTVAINLSARQFDHGDLTGAVRDRLEEIGLHPGCLHVELTETAVIDPRPDFLDQLKRLCELGVQIGLDDFGTGYASLTHLRLLPLTFVKIDQSFVRGLGAGRDDDRIVSAVVDLAANLGLRSIAEGVETTVQLERLREFGCDQAQGFLFARPLPADDAHAAVQDAAW